MRTAPGRTLSFLLLFLAVLSGSPAASAQTHPTNLAAEAEFYGTWQGAQFRAPPAVSLDRPPAPLAEEPEVARRSFELGAEFGAAVPHCAQSGGIGCSMLSGGTEVGLNLLLRPSPYFAFGGEVRLLAFTFGNRPLARASASFAGVAGRVYFFEDGNIDPYLELGLGVGSLDMTARDGGPELSEEADFAPAARVAGGIDFVFSSHLRAGPFLGLTRYAPASVVHCAAGSCAALETRFSGIAIGATSLGVRLTLAAGEML